MAEKKILITGAGGMLAQDLVATLQTSCAVIPRSEYDLDICNREAVHDTICSVQPDAVINCAAFTQVDECETEKDTAFAVNAGGVKNLALACHHAACRLFHISTDYVFDGTKGKPYAESDEPHPLSVYGQSKLEGERYIRDILQHYVIVRSLWLYGRGGGNFVSTIIRLAGEHREIKVVNDQKGCPTWTLHLSQAIRALLDIDAQGIYHIANQGSCTWYEYACKIVERAGGGATVTPITSAQINRPAPRPAYSVLDCSRFTRETGMALKPWDIALEEYFKSSI